MNKNGILQVGDAFVQCVSDIHSVSRVVLPLTFSGMQLAPWATDGLPVAQAGNGFLADRGGFTLYCLGNFVKFNDDLRYYFSPGEYAFYQGQYTHRLPDDAIALTAEYWQELVAGINCHNIEVVGGKPVLVEPAAVELPRIPTTVRDFLFDIRKRRNECLSALDWVVLRHTRQGFLGVKQTLSESDMKAIETYREALCDFTEELDMDQTIGSPDDLVWPQLDVSVAAKIA